MKLLIGPGRLLNDFTSYCTKTSTTDGLSGGILTKGAGYRHGDFIDTMNLTEDPVFEIFKQITEKIGKTGFYVNEADSTYGAFFKYF